MCSVGFENIKCRMYNCGVGGTDDWNAGAVIDRQRVDVGIDPYDIELPTFNCPLSTVNKKRPPGWVVFLLAEMEGFEPPHALRRLADFESAPFSHLGTSPCAMPLYQQARKKSSLSLFC